MGEKEFSTCPEGSVGHWRHEHAVLRIYSWNEEKGRERTLVETSVANCEDLPRDPLTTTGVWGCSDLHLCAHQCWTLLVQCLDQIKSGSGRCLHDVQNLGTGLQHWLTWRSLNLKGVSRAALWKQCMFKTLKRTQEKILATSGTGDKVCDNQHERPPSLSPEF